MQESLAEQSNDTINDPFTAEFLTLNYAVNQFSMNQFIHVSWFQKVTCKESGTIDSARQAAPLGSRMESKALV